MIEWRTCGKCGHFLPDPEPIVAGQQFEAWFGNCAVRQGPRQQAVEINNFCDGYERKDDESN